MEDFRLGPDMSGGSPAELTHGDEKNKGNADKYEDEDRGPDIEEPMSYSHNQSERDHQGGEGLQK